MAGGRGVRAYRRLLRLFPRAFREKHGEEFERLFEDMRTEWEEVRGGVGPGFWMSLAWDTVRGAAGEWLSLSQRITRSATATTVEDQMSAIIGDIRYALRQLLRQPTYSLTIILLMTLGIAGNAAVFRVFNGLFLRPLPFQEAERLVDLDETAPQWDLEFVNVAYPDFVAWRRGNRTFESMTVFRSGGSNLSVDGSAQRVTSLAATHDIDEVLSLEPRLGRFFTAEEDVPDGPAVGLISSALWEQQFGRDPQVVGRTVTLDGRTLEIIGVLPTAARFAGDADIWTPLQRPESDSEGWGLRGVGKLLPGVSPEQAEADLTAVHRGLVEERSVNQITSPVVHSLRDRFLGSYRMGSGFLLAAVAIVLLIACANIAGLMFARSLAREAEISVRRAMGAPRLRIIRQLLTESALLAVLGASAGSALGVWASALLVDAMTGQFPPWVTFDLDGRFVAFTVVVTAGAAVLFGLAPAVTASRSRLNPSTQGRATVSGGKRRVMGSLVTAEVALATVLLVVGGLSALDVHRLGRVDPGYRSEGMLTYQVQLPGPRYPDPPSRGLFARDYAEKLSAIPGVTDVTFASSLPLKGHWGWFFEAEGHTRTEDEANPVVLNRIVTPGYFAAMDIPILQGRALNEFDGREAGSTAVVVNETFVRTHLSHVDDPVGARVRTGPNGGWLTVVGVARDVKHYGVDEEMRPGVYQPWRQMPVPFFNVVLATDGNQEAVIQGARAATAEMDPELPLFSLETLDESLEESLWTRRATSALIAVFSVVALLLAVAGIYGVISYAVGQRTQEISIRMAMGAERTQVRTQVVRQGMVLVLFGTLLGLLAAFAGGQVVAGMLVGVDPREPLVYAGVAVLLLTVAAVANYLPARRAAAVDPMRTLRGE